MQITFQVFVEKFKTVFFIFFGAVSRLSFQSVRSGSVRNRCWFGSESVSVRLDLEPLPAWFGSETALIRLGTAFGFGSEPFWLRLGTDLRSDRNRFWPGSVGLGTDFGVVWFSWKPSLIRFGADFASIGNIFWLWVGTDFDSIRNRFWLGSEPISVRFWIRFGTDLGVLRFGPSRLDSVWFGAARFRNGSVRFGIVFGSEPV